MLDIVLYDDGHQYNLDDYLYSIDKNRFLCCEYGELHYILPSLLTNEENNVLQLHVDGMEKCDCTIILRPHTILRENIIFPENLTVRTLGIESCLPVLKGDKVLFLHQGDKVQELEPIDLSDELKDFSLSGTILDVKDFRYIMGRIHYRGIVTADMLYLALLSFPKYHHAKRLDPKSYDYICHYPSLIDYYNYLLNRVSNDMEYCDKGDVVRQVVRAQKESF